MIFSLYVYLYIHLSGYVFISFPVSLTSAQARSCSYSRLLFRTLVLFRACARVTAFAIVIANPLKPTSFFSSDTRPQWPWISADHPAFMLSRCNPLRGLPSCREYIGWIFVMRTRNATLRSIGKRKRKDSWFPLIHRLSYKHRPISTSVNEG